MRNVWIMSHYYFLFVPPAETSLRSPLASDLMFPTVVALEAPTAAWRALSAPGRPVHQIPGLSEIQRMMGSASFSGHKTLHEFSP